MDSTPFIRRNTFGSIISMQHVSSPSHLFFWAVHCYEEDLEGKKHEKKKASSQWEIKGNLESAILDMWKGEREMRQRKAWWENQNSW